MVARSSISLLIFCLILSITERVVLKSPTTTVNSFVPSFVYISFCFMYLEAVFFNCFSSTVVSISLHHYPTPQPSLPPTSILPPFGFVHVSFIHVPCWPFPYFPPLSLFPSDYCQCVLNFSVSGYILLACLFC